MKKILYILISFCIIQGCKKKTYEIEFDPLRHAMTILNEDWYIYELTFYNENSTLLFNITNINNIKINPTLDLKSCDTFSCIGSYQAVQAVNKCAGTAYIKEKANINRVRRIDFEIDLNVKSKQIFTSRFQ